MQDSDNWKTPNWLMTLFPHYIDACPPDYTEDYLTSNWSNEKFVYINPPYSNPLPFVLKAIKDHEAWGTTIILLLKMDSSTKWYKALVEAKAHFLYFAERLHYSESRDSPPFSSVLAILSD